MIFIYVNSSSSKKYHLNAREVLHSSSHLPHLLSSGYSPVFIFTLNNYFYHFIRNKTNVTNARSNCQEGTIEQRVDAKSRTLVPGGDFEPFMIPKRR